MERDRFRVLLVEDDEDDFIMLKDLLVAAPGSKFFLDWVSDYETALQGICGGKHDVYILDYLLGARTGLELMRELSIKGCTAPVIFLTGHGAYEIEVEAMRLGAADYLVKAEITSDLLERSIRHSIDRKRKEDELRRARDELEVLLGRSHIELDRAMESLRLETARRKRAEADRERLIADLQSVLGKAIAPTAPSPTGRR